MWLVARAVFALCALAANTAASQSATMSVSGNPASLLISSAVAGLPPTSVTDASTSYAVDVSSGSWRITATVDIASPSGVTHALSLAAPTGATSLGSVVLSTIAQDVVSGINAGTYAGLGIRYTLTATAAAGTVSQRSAIVTFTLVQEP